MITPRAAQRDETEVRSLLTATNPVPVDRVDALAEDTRAQQALNSILASPRGTERSNGAVRWGAPTTPRKQLVTRRAVLSAGAFVVASAAASGAVLAAGVVPLPWNQTAPAAGAFAATPPVLAYQPLSGDAVDALHAVAARVQALPNDVGSGRYARVSTQSWSLWTRVGGDSHTVHSVVMPEEKITWIAADGSGRSVTHYKQPGHLWATDEKETFTTGKLSLMWPLGSLSVDDKELATQLATGHPEEDGPAERLVAITDLYGQQPVEPPVRAAVLRYLAATPGLQLTGTVIDRLGRSGLAVSLDSDYGGLPTQYTLVINPEDGRLLDREEMLTATAGKLDVPVPSVIGYTAYRSSRYTDDLG